MHANRQSAKSGIVHLLAQSGFSLMELLVVIVVIGILAALLLPVLPPAKKKGYDVQCKGNLRQLGIALQVYVSSQAVYPLGTESNAIGAWPRLLLPTSSNSLCFYCPQSIQANSNYTDLVGLPTSNVKPHYGYNAQGTLWTPSNPPPNLGLGGKFVPLGLQSKYEPLREGDVRYPGEMIALGDSGGYTRPLVKHMDKDAVFYVAIPFKVQVLGEKPIIGTDIVGNWHNGCANMVFCDGHVESKKQSDWTATNDNARSQWNNDHNPHPEYWGGR
jgi:prepilin-type N-terminal cleavage/methylation domain-containing protein/prepilin-type processing-associated H-X9-DG protein